MSKRIVTRQFLVYLASPITGMSWEEATAWYAEAEKRFPPHIIPMKPLRGKEYLSKERSIKDHYDTTASKLISSRKAILMRDRNDVKRSDGVLVNLLQAKKVSIGSVMEIAWAYDNNKPLVMIMQEDSMHRHSMIEEAGLVFTTLDEGINAMIQLVSPL